MKQDVAYILKILSGQFKTISRLRIPGKEGSLDERSLPPPPPPHPTNLFFQQGPQRKPGKELLLKSKPEENF